MRRRPRRRPLPRVEPCAPGSASSSRSTTSGRGPRPRPGRRHHRRRVRVPRCRHARAGSQRRGLRQRGRPMVGDLRSHVVRCGGARVPPPLPARGRRLPLGPHVRRRRHHARGDGAGALQICYFMGLFSAMAWGRSRRSALLVTSTILVFMLCWVAWQFAIGQSVQAWLDDADADRALRLPAAHPGDHPAHLHRQRRLLRRRHRRRPGRLARRSAARGARRAGHTRSPGRRTRSSSAPSSTSGCESRASCTTSSATTCPSSASRPPVRAACSTEIRPQPPARSA